MKYCLTAALAAALACTPSVGVAQSKKGEEAKWDVNAPPMKTRKVQISVDEGTWMNLDVSPDGSTIVFDLLGDIYTMPISGGTPRRISSGLAFDQHPRFSPDGSKIAFTSDRGGGDNIWIMDSSGANARQLTKEDFRLLNNPSWSPDGQYIIARKHFTTQRSLGTGEIWIYHIDGGSGVALVKKPSEQHQKELGEPMFAPDGKSFYYSKDATPGPIFQYAQDSNGQLFVIERYDMETGEISRVAGGPGGAVRPTPSPDGRWLAFVRRERSKSKLYIKDLQSGAERKIYDDLDLDLQETWAVHGVYPNMDWLPDNRTLVFWAGGKIHRIDVESRANEVIPFRVSDDRTVIDPVRPTTAVAPDTFTTTMPRFASLSPDGSQVVFESLGKLYVKPASGGAPRLLVSNGGSDFELFPSWSRDGSQVVYVSWDDLRLGEVRVVPAAGGEARTVSKTPGHYRRPQFAPDGRSVVVEMGGGGGITSDDWATDPGIHLIDLSNGASERIASGGSDPHFGASADRIYFSKGGGGLTLVSVDRHGHAEREVAKGDLINAFRVSPDGRTLLFRENYQAFAAPLLPGSATLSLDSSSRIVPITQLSDEGAEFLDWSGAGKATWLLGPTLYSASMQDVAAARRDGKFSPPTSGISLAMQVAADKPQGVVALTNARIITMSNKDGGVIENGTILIRDNRIVAVGPSVAIPADAKTVDLGGKTVYPGLVDAHAHGPQGDDEIIPQQNWHTIAHLALGVTTVHDPSNDSSEVFAASEYQRAGKYLAPRIFSTGEIVYGAKAPGVYAQINSLEDARDHIQRLKAQGATSVKNYNQPRRDQRQQVVAAAIAENVRTVAEGGSLFGMDMTLIADGNTTLEHNIPQATLYEDVLSFFSQTKVGYTPTLVVTYGGPAADPYWRSHTDIWKHPILSRHVPRRQLEASSVRREIAPEEDYVDRLSAAQAKKLAERGVLVSIGAHGQEEGLGSHWELWSFVRGGMSPVEALAAGTIVSARSLGMDKDIGSIEPGKLADLVVVDGNPLSDIQDTDNITQVMLNGRLYDPLTMSETVTGNATLRPYAWQE